MSSTCFHSGSAVGRGEAGDTGFGVRGAVVTAAYCEAGSGPGAARSCAERAKAHDRLEPLASLQDELLVGGARDEVGERRDSGGKHRSPAPARGARYACCCPWPALRSPPMHRN